MNAVEIDRPDICPADEIASLESVIANAQARIQELKDPFDSRPTLQSAVNQFLQHPVLENFTLLKSINEKQQRALDALKGTK